MEYTVNGYKMLVGNKYAWMKRYIYQDSDKFYYYTVSINSLYENQVEYYPQDGLVSISSLNDKMDMKGDIRFAETLVDAIKDANGYEISTANILPDKYNRSKKLSEILD